MDRTGDKANLATRSTPYADELATAHVAGDRIERVRIRKTGEEKIRFWWKRGNLAPRPLDMAEGRLLVLLAAAIGNGAFSESLLRDLQMIINAYLGDYPLG